MIPIQKHGPDPLFTPVGPHRPQPGPQVAEPDPTKPLRHPTEVGLSQAQVDVYKGARDRGETHEQAVARVNRMTTDPDEFFTGDSVVDSQRQKVYNSARDRGETIEQATQRALRVNPIQSAPKAPTAGEFTGSMIRSGLQGATLGTADEISGGIEALGALVPGGRSPGEAYRETVDEIRGDVRDFGENAPAIRTASEIAGGLLTGSAFTKAMPAALNRASAILRGFTAGAGAGGAYGFGVGEGSVSERLPGALAGAAGGAVVGTALPVVAGGARMGVNAVRDLTGLRGPRSAADRAGDVVLRALDRSKTSLDDVEARLAATDKPLSLVDVGGENARGLGRLVGSMPGEGRETMTRRLAGRMEGQGARVAGDLETGLGARKGGILQLRDELIDQRAREAGPMYEKALGTGTTIDDPKLVKLLRSDRPSIAAARKRAQRIASEEGAEAFGENAPLTARDLHYLKLGLDDEIRQMARTGESGGSGGTLYSKMLGTRDVLVDGLDRAIPGYREARGVYAGRSALLDALEEGEDALRGRTSPEEIKRRMQTLTDGEKDAFRRGALEQLVRKVEEARDNWDAVPRIFGSLRDRARMRELFPTEEAFDEFAERMLAESEMAASRNAVLVGSRTAPMQAEALDFTSQALSAGGELATGGPLRAILGLLKRSLFDRARGVTEKTAGDVAELLSAGAGEGSAQDVVKRLRGLQGRETERGLRRSGTTTAVAGLAGGGLGRLTGGNR